VKALVGRLLDQVRRLGPRGRVLLGAVGLVMVVALVVVLSQAGDDEGSALPATTTTTTPAPTTTAPTADGPTTTTVVPTTTTTTRSTPTAVAPVADPDPQPIAVRPPVRCASQGPPTTGTVPDDSPQGGKRWVTVGLLVGNCDGTSGSFEVKGIDTRLVVRNDATSFNVFIVDVDQGRDATAGFSDLSCGGPCAETQTLVLGAGTYRLEIQADDAPWAVAVQEYRAG
jgi:hypothetical protein